MKPIRNALALAGVLAQLAWPAAPAVAAAAIATETELEPASPWSIDTADNSCRLRRMFGTSQAPVLLQLSAAYPGTSFEFRLYGAPVKQLLPDDDATDRLLVDFGIGDPTRVRGLAGSSNATAGLLVFATKLPTLGDSYEVRDFDPAFLEQSSRMAFASADHRITLNTGNPADALAAMSECTTALVARWGLDPKTQASLSRPAAPKDKASFTRRILSIQYPVAQARAGKGGRVDVLVLLDSNGSVTKCMVPNAIGHSAFGETTCAAIMKVPFAPALDKNGTPVPSFYGISVLFLIG